MPLDPAPPSVTICHTFSGRPLPLERDVLYGRPQDIILRVDLSL